MAGGHNLHVPEFSNFQPKIFGPKYYNYLHIFYNYLSDNYDFDQLLQPCFIATKKTPYWGKIAFCSTNSPLFSRIFGVHEPKVCFSPHHLSCLNRSFHNFGHSAHFTHTANLWINKKNGYTLNPSYSSHRNCNFSLIFVKLPRVYP